ncbi:hypothetical protein T439DRAFT_322218 [Meredithblackwellia eburnea MCA 4105]
MSYSHPEYYDPPASLAPLAVPNPPARNPTFNLTVKRSSSPLEQQQQQHYQYSEQSKRVRLTPPIPDSIAITPALPTTLALLCSATHLHSKASNLHSFLTKKPSSTVREQQYASAWLEYHRLEGTALSLLESVIQGVRDGSGRVGGGRLDLRARILAIEILVGRGDLAEAGRVAAKGLSETDKHSDLKPYAPIFYSLQASLPSPTATAASHLKFSKTLLRRALSTTSPKDFPQWIYQFHLQLFSLSSAASDFAGAMLALRDVEKFAAGRGDDNVVWATRVLRCRLVLGDEETGRTAMKDAMEVVCRWMGMGEKEAGSSQSKPNPTQAAGQPAPPPPPVPAAEFLKSQIKLIGRNLVVQFLLVYSLFMARTGDVKGAKEKLKLAHQLLDSRDVEPGDLEGWFKMPIKPVESYSTPAVHLPPSTLCIVPPPPSGDSITLQLSPQSMVYGMAFLVSVAVHRDPFGNKPRCRMFGVEGLRALDAKLSGSETLPPLLPTWVTPHLISLARIKVHLLLFSAELSIMRSEYVSARSELNTALSTMRQYDLWPSTAADDVAFKARLTLDEGLLAQALGRNKVAEQCFEVVLSLESGNPSDLTPLALLSLLLVRLSQGQRPSTLTPLTQQILDSISLNSSSTTTTDPAPASLKLVADFAIALTKGEIVRAKQYLSNALLVANATVCNHAKAAVLALLANLFLLTRNDQAQKMLSASYGLTRGMGPRKDTRTDGERESGVVGEENVGNARLGIWVGERLWQSFRRTDASKARRQEELNMVHRRVLERELNDGLS